MNVSNPMLPDRRSGPPEPVDAPRTTLFISHKLKDARAARDLGDTLRALCVLVKISDDIKPGANWRERIKEQLIAADNLLLLHSDHHSD